MAIKVDLVKAWEAYREVRWPDRREEWSHHWREVSISFAASVLGAINIAVEQEAKAEALAVLAKIEPKVL